MPMMGVFIVLALLAFVVVGSLSCLVLGGWIFGWKRTGIISAVGIVVLVAMEIRLAATRPNHTVTPKMKADSLMSIPAEAQVVSAKEGDWAGDGRVVFRMPKNRPTEEWFEIIWGMNRVGGPKDTVNGRYPLPVIKRSEEVNGNRRSLEYRPFEQVFVYDVELNL
ncbi:hypothetical protein ACYOEI_26470 [Singulisphaera rosea]